MAGDEAKPNPLAALVGKTESAPTLGVWVARRRAASPPVVPAPPAPKPPDESALPDSVPPPAPSAPARASAPGPPPPAFARDLLPWRGLGAVEGMGDPFARDLSALLAGGAWREAQAQFDRLSTSDERLFYVETLAGASAPSIDAWREGRPDSPLPCLLRGRARLEEARRAGGPRSLLQAAEADFVHAFNVHPGDGHAYAYLAVAGAALGLDEEIVAKRFEAARTSDPENRLAHLGLLRLTAPESAPARARDLARGTREGSGLPLLVLEAHLLAWDARAPRDLSYFRDPRVAAEIAEARRRSVGHVSWRETVWAAVDRNALAFAAVLSGDRAAAREEFGLLGERIASWPWSLLGDPVAAYREARASVF